MNMKTILALTIGALVSLTAQADADPNYIKLPDYNDTPAYQAPGSGEDDGGDYDYSDNSPAEEAEVPNYEDQQTPKYSSNDTWGAVKAACDKRENDPYRISGQLSPLRIQIICTQVSSIEARIQAKGMDTYEVKSEPVQSRRWKKDVLCEDLVNANYDLNVLCGQKDNQDYEDEGSGS
jgi:hypothetical protein